jgi:NAD(P)-dependent dehydrogenase (short-subunit alcohol dehydrogenase family)
MVALDQMRVAVVDAEGPLGAPALAALSAAGAAVARVAVAPDGDAAAGVERAIAELGGLDVLANLSRPTAGDEPAADVSRADFEDLFKVSLRTARTSNQAAFRHLSASGGGQVINHAEMSGELGEAGRALPATIAQAIVAWSRAAAGAWFFQGVRVNIFQPGSGANMERSVIPTLLFLISGDATLHGQTVSC